MKKFLLTRFAIQNFDVNWLEYHLSIFETLTLPSIEANISDTLYWVIVINKDVPIEYKRQLNRICTGSILRKNIYILEIDYYFEVYEKFHEFISQHVDECEPRMEIRFDSDDMLCKGLLDSTEKAAIDKNKPRAIYTYENIYYFYIHEQVADIKRAPYLGLNSFFVTDTLEHSAFVVPHKQYPVWAENNGYYTEVLKSEFPTTSYTISLGSTWQQYLNLSGNKVSINEGTRNNGKSIFDILPNFTVPDYEKISRFLSRFPVPVLSQTPIVDKHVLAEKAKQISHEYRLNKRLYIESIDYSDYSKPKHAELCDENKDNYSSHLERICGIYGMDYTALKDLTSIKGGKDYLRKCYDIINNADNGYVICMATVNGFENSLFNPKSYASIITGGECKYDLSTGERAEQRYEITLGRLFHAVGICRQPFEKTVPIISLQYINYAIDKPGLDIVIFDTKSMCCRDSVNIDILSGELTLTR